MVIETLNACNKKWKLWQKADDDSTKNTMKSSDNLVHRNDSVLIIAQQLVLSLDSV